MSRAPTAVVKIPARSPQPGRGKAARPGVVGPLGGQEKSGRPLEKVNPGRPPPGLTGAAWRGIGPGRRAAGRSVAEEDRLLLGSRDFPEAGWPKRKGPK